MTAERERAEQTLAKLVDDVRRQPASDIDWDEAEAALLRRVAHDVPVASISSRRAGWGWAVSAAALVAFLGGVLAVSRNESHLASATKIPSPSAPAPAADTRVDGDALVVGSTVVSGATATVVTHRGHAVWTLEPNSAAHIESVGDVIAVALDSGAVAARVTKSPRPESFVVRVEQTRVAVHGTAFRVERRAGTTLITVAEGVVGVGPVGKEPFELTAPASATVTFDGIRTDLPFQTGGNGTFANPSTKEHSKGGPATREQPAPGATGDIDRVESTVRRCFGELTVSRGDLRVTVSTHMSLHVNRSGKVDEASFDPPLLPSVRACVDADLQGMVFPKGAEGVAVERVLELER